MLEPNPPGIDTCSCAGSIDGNGAETIKIPVVAGTPVYLVVDAEVSNASGVFELGVVVTPAICGNGATEGGEQCDDSNEVGGDGCSGLRPRRRPLATSPSPA